MSRRTRWTAWRWAPARHSSTTTSSRSRSSRASRPLGRPPVTVEPARPAAAFVDLHCHTSASFDSLATPAAVVRAAAARGLTHLAITDHDRIVGALEAQALAAREAPGLTVLVGQEIRTTGGDMIGLFLHEPVAPGLAPAAA